MEEHLMDVSEVEKDPLETNTFLIHSKREKKVSERGRRLCYHD